MFTKRVRLLLSLCAQSVTNMYTSSSKRIALFIQIVYRMYSLCKQSVSSFQINTSGITEVNFYFWSDFLRVRYLYTKCLLFVYVLCTFFGFYIGLGFFGTR